MGYEPASILQQADIVVINSCSVRQSAIDRIFGQLRACSPRQKTVLTGCVLPKEKEQFEDMFDIIMDIKDLASLPSFLSLLSQDVPETNPEPISIPTYEEKHVLRDYLDIVPEYQDTFSANVPIMTGCNNFCTYCAVPYTRGREVSRSSQEIINEVEHLIQRGYKEIWLLGQSVNSYYWNVKTTSQISKPTQNSIITFPALLRQKIGRASCRERV